MLRGAAPRTVIAALAAVLLALQFFTPTTSFASAHTLGHVKAKATPGKALPATPVRDPAATARACGHSEDPTGPVRTRDRHRATTHTASGAPVRPSQGENPAVVSEPERSSARHHRQPRSRTAPTPAALQVFRC
ncbi:hypothetical protein [Streptomyces sp. HM190]|uniref:hypothetical protein n=1 Tax=Streptomyces sp. HM190 TaxID=2695266 RepID=UPI00191788DF|nr:hypothetical protein [Streptomyces sp. HM190]